MSPGRRTLLCLVTFLAMINACATGPDVDPFATEGRIWPEPPAAPRLAFVLAFTRPDDLGIQPGFWGRLVGAVAGAEDEAMLRPMDVAASTDGDMIYVADPDARCVHRYDLDRGRYDCLMISRDEALVSPIGLTVLPEGRVFIADSIRAAIYYADPGDGEVQKFETSVELEQPTGIAWDKTHNLLLVTDTGSQSIKVFDHQGELVSEIGARGERPGEFNFPTYLWFDPNDELLVTDSLNFRIQRFGDAGDFISVFGENGNNVGYFARPKGLATDSHGHVYVVDGLLNAMQVFSREGEFLMAVGTRGQGPGEFWLPNGIFVSGDDTIYVADSYNKRVQVFRYVGPEE